MGLLPESGKNPYTLPTQGGASTGQMAEMYQQNKKLNRLWVDVRSDFGAVADGETDDTAAIIAAIAAAPEGWTVYFPPGVYIVTPDPVSGNVFSLDTPGLEFFGPGATIKMADDSGNFSNIFAGSTAAVDCSRTKFLYLTFDLNLENNVIPLDDDAPDDSIPDALQGSMGAGYTRRRNPIHLEVGDGIHVEGCTFLNSPRQCVWVANASDKTAITGAVLARNHCLTTITGTGDWDTTALFVIGDRCQIIDNEIRGFPTNYFISRTSVQLSGSSGRVVGNIIDKYYRGPVVGNANYDGCAVGNIVSGNVMTDVNLGITIDAMQGPTYTDGPGVDDMLVIGNTIKTNKSDYARDTVVASVPAGIEIRDTGKFLPIKNLRIAQNIITNDQFWTTDGGAGISLIHNPSPGDPEADPPEPPYVMPGHCKNIVVENNTIDYPSMSGVLIDMMDCVNLKIRENDITNPGLRDDLSSSYFTGVRMGGTASMVTIAGNNVIDDRDPAIVTSAVNILGSADLIRCRIIPGELWVEDGTLVPYRDVNAVGVEIPAKWAGSSQDVVTSTTLVDSELVLHLLPHTAYAVAGVLSVEGAVDGDIKIGFTTPASAAGFWNVLGPQDAATTGANTGANMLGRLWTESATCGTVGASTPVMVRVDGWIRTDDAGGDLTLQFAQGTSDATATSIRARSYLTVTPMEPV